MYQKFFFRIKRLLAKMFFGNLSTNSSPNRVSFPIGIKIQTPQATLDVCISLITNKKRGVYLRFGDGDINLLEAKDELLQKANITLKREMEETFNLFGDGIIKSLPLHSPRFGISAGMKPGIHGSDDEWAENLLARCHLYFIGTPIYSSVALPYIAAFDPQSAIRFLQIFKEQTPIFVGNKNVPDDILKKLFGDGNWIRTAPENGYSEIDRIENDVIAYLDNTNYKVIVIAMGCSGRILAKRIYTKGYNAFIFDFGSLLDAFCGWNTRAWMEFAPFDVRKLLEEI